MSAGEVLHIEFLRGGKTLYKSGEGRLEIGVVENTNLNVVVSNGTFAAGKPTSLDLSEDEHVIFHLDVNKASTVTTVEADDGTLFVKEVRDADGRTDRKLTTLTGRPDARYLPAGINGLGTLDFGSLQNAAATGYGAALAFDLPVSGAFEMLCVFEDDPDAKYRAKSIGPCPYGTASSIHIRGYVENGTNAPIHYTTIGGRAQSGNFIDGVQFGQTGPTGKDYQFKSVPDGPHVMRNKINKVEHGAFENVLGFGFSETTDKAYRSYGGLKIAEAIFFDTTSEWETTRDEVRIYQNYLMLKYLNVATLGQVTLLGDSTLDTSGAPLQCRLQWYSLSANVTSAKNLLPQGCYEAGNPVLAVDGAEYRVPSNQKILPGLSFPGHAAFALDSTATVARVDGAGTLVKKGDGSLLVGVHDARLTSLDVQAGTLRIAPLEASGSWMHVDPTVRDTMTFDPLNGTNFVTKWLDVEHGQTYLQKTTTKYQFADRSVGTPYISDKTLNGLPLIDYGAYTSEVYPDGNGGAFIPSLALSNTQDAPGMRNFFVIWGDYDEIADLPLYNGNQLRGPGILAGDDGWGYRGFGGGGKTCPIFSETPSVGTYHVSANSFVSIDGESFDYTAIPYTARPGKGMHVLDQQVGSTGARLHYIGGCKWQAGYYGGIGNGPHPGVWGGVRMGEILIYRNLLPAYFRSRIAAVLGTKWFNRTNTLAYASVSVAPGAALDIPDTWVRADTLSLGGRLTVNEVVTESLALTADATVEGRLVLADGGTVSLTCNETATLPRLCSDAFIAAGDITLSFALTPDRLSDYAGRTFSLIEGVSDDFSASQVHVNLPTAVRQKGAVMKVSVVNGVLTAAIDVVGLAVLVR